jgi:hypothetical protein
MYRTAFLLKRPSAIALSREQVLATVAQQDSSAVSPFHMPVVGGRTILVSSIWYKESETNDILLGQTSERNYACIACDHG